MLFHYAIVHRIFLFLNFLSHRYCEVYQELFINQYKKLKSVPIRSRLFMQEQQTWKQTGLQELNYSKFRISENGEHHHSVSLPFITFYRPIIR